jgi:hypothetical protein
MKTFKIILVLLAALGIGGFILFSLPENRQQIKTKHFTFRFSSSIDTTNITELADALESNYQRIGSDLVTTPADNIEVNLYARRWEYLRATKNWSGSGSIEGTSKLHFVEQAWGEPDSRKVALHEFAHTVTLKLLLEQAPQPLDAKSFDNKFATFPTWLWEAISVYEAQEFVDPKSLPYLTSGRTLTIAELNKRTKGGKIYSCGYTIIEYILLKYRKEGLLKLIANYGDLQTTFNVTDEEFCSAWYEFVKTKYLS